MCLCVISLDILPLGIYVSLVHVRGMEIFDFDVLKKELVLRGYSRRTVKAYLDTNRKFLEFIRKSPREVSCKDIESYFLMLAENGLSPASRHAAVAALKFYYCTVLKRKFALVYPKIGKHLPLIVPKESIRKMISSLENVKHRLFLLLLYSSGLRVSEAINMKFKDIDPEGGVLYVRKGKGDKDRMVILSECFIKEFVEFRKTHASKEFVFFSQRDSSRHISIRAAQSIVVSAARDAGLGHLYCHALRSSFATHLIEAGTGIHHVQRLLGHSNVGTTQRYISLSKKDLLSVKSPLDT